MKTLLRILLPVLVLAVGGRAAFELIVNRPHLEAAPPEVVLPRVRAELVERGPYDVVVAAQGTVTPRSESDLTAQVAGRVVAVSPALAAGGFFDAGEVLVELEATDYELALAQAELAVAQAARHLAEVEADADVARREWQELGEGEATALTLREPQLAEARASLAAAEAGRAKAALDVERTQVRASYAGRVRAKQVGPGDWVTPGRVLARVYAVDWAEVRLPLADADLAFLDVPLGPAADAAGDLVARLSAEFAGARHEWPARVVRTEGELDPRTRMVTLVARVEDPYGRAAVGDAQRVPLAVGMFVDAALTGRTLEDVWVVPRAALRDGPQVFALEHDGDDVLLRRRDVEVVFATRDEVVLRGAALEDTLEVVTTPLEAATDGMLVARVEPAPAAE